VCESRGLREIVYTDGSVVIPFEHGANRFVEFGTAVFVDADCIHPCESDVVGGGNSAKVGKLLISWVIGIEISAFHMKASMASFSAPGLFTRPVVRCLLSLLILSSSNSACIRVET
jgi:hypothetical protein